MKTRKSTLALVIAAALGLASCQDFFTSSLGAWAKRATRVPANLTEAQALEIADMALTNRDTDLAQALLPQMADFVASGGASDEVVAASVSTAILASGIDDAFGEALTSLGIDVLTSGSLTPEQTDELAAILGSVTVDEDALTIYTYLAGLDASEMEDAGVTATDYAMAAATLLIAQASAEGVSVSDLIDGTAALDTGSANYLLADSLLTAASSMDSAGDIYDMIDGWI